MSIKYKYGHYIDLPAQREMLYAATCDSERRRFQAAIITNNCLAKFRGWDDNDKKESVIESIRNGRLYFSTALGYNDPYDTLMYIDKAGLLKFIEQTLAVRMPAYIESQKIKNFSVGCFAQMYNTPQARQQFVRCIDDRIEKLKYAIHDILFPEQLQEAAQRRSERKSAVQITEAQKELRRLCNGRPSAAVESQVLSMLNCLVAAPEQIKPQPRTVNRGELAEMERRFSAALTTSPVDEGDAKELALRLAGMQYSTIGSSEYESQRLRHLFTAAAPMAEIDAELLKSAVSQIYVKKGQTSLLLKNGQIIERRA